MVLLGPVPKCRLTAIASTRPVPGCTAAIGAARLFAYP
jgi:hypothetical protein